MNSIHNNICRQSIDKATGQMQPVLLLPVTMQKAMLQCAMMGEALQVAQLQEQKIHQDLQTDVKL